MTPFADGGPRSILVLDNAKIHHSAELTEMCLDAGILLVYLPPYSCDYNPIETLFAVLKRYIKKNRALIDGHTEEGTPISNIKYDHPGSQNDNLFYPFHNQLDYALAHYFAESETTKGNVDKFLSNPLMAPLIKKLSHQNADK